jgi:hypothetical protein
MYLAPISTQSASRIYFHQYTAARSNGIPGVGVEEDDPYPLLPGEAGSYLERDLVAIFYE